MKSFKKALRLVFLALIILLASIGVSLGGGIPVPIFRKREDGAEIRIELVESKENKTNDTDWEYKQ